MFFEKCYAQKKNHCLKKCNLVSNISKFGSRNLFRLHMYKKNVVTLVIQYAWMCDFCFGYIMVRTSYTQWYRHQTQDEQ